MDIRKEIKQILEKYGYTVIYVRADKRFRCSCHSEREGESNTTNCKLCFGTGYKSKVERVVTRRKPLAMPESLVAVRKNAGPGNIVAAGYTYYFEHDIVPKSGDFILEVLWQEKQPVKIKEKLLISAVDEKDGLHGQTEFYQVYARTHWIEEGDKSGISQNGVSTT